MHHSRALVVGLCVLLLLFVLGGCGGAAKDQAGPGQAGHWAGDPQVSFDVTEDGTIRAFRMVVPFGAAGQACTIESDSIAVGADGTLSIGAGEDAAVTLKGQFAGRRFAGTYKVAVCPAGDLYTVVLNPEERAWSAEWQGEGAPAEPVALATTAPVSTPAAAPGQTRGPTPAAAPALAEPPPLSQAASAFAGDLPQVEQRAATEESMGTALAWAPDSQRIAVAALGLHFFMPGVDRELDSVRGLQWVNSVAYAPDGRTLAYADAFGVTLHDVVTGQDVHAWAQFKNASQVAFSPDGTLLAVAPSEPGLAIILDAAGGQVLHTLEGNPCCSSNSIAFSPDGSRVAGGAESLHVWDLASGRELFNLTEHQSGLTSVAFSPDGRFLVSASNNTMVNVYDATSGALLHTLAGHSGPVTSIAFTPDSRLLASASYDATIKIWDPYTGQELRTLSGHTAWVEHVAFSPDGSMLASAGQDAAMRLWGPPSSAAATVRPAPTPTPLPAQVQGTQAGQLDGFWPKRVSWSPDGRLLAVAGYGLALVDGQTLAQVGKVGDDGWVLDVTFAPDGRTIAAAYTSGNVALWTPEGGEMDTLPGTDGASLVTFSPDGSRLAASVGRVVQVLDVAGGDLLFAVDAGRSYSSAAFSPDGRWLVTEAQSPETFAVWEVASGNKVQGIQGQAGVLSALAWSPDGRMLVVGFGDSTIHAFDTTSWQQVHRLVGHQGSIGCLAFSPDGRWLASGASDVGIRIWEAASGQALGYLSGHTDAVTSLGFAPDGRLASASNDGSVRIWSLASRGADPGPLPALPAPAAVPPPVPLAPSAISALNAAQVKQVGLFEFHMGAHSLAWSPDGRILALGTKPVGLYDAHSQQLVMTIDTDIWPEDLLFAPGGRVLAGTAGSGSGILLWDVEGGGELLAIPADANAGSLAFSPDGTLLAAAQGKTIRIWEAATGQEVRQLEGHLQTVADVAFAPDGRAVASCDSGNIWLWDHSSGQQVDMLWRAKNGYLSIAFSPDGRTLASGSSDETITLWNVASRQERSTLLGHTGRITGIAFSPNGQILATSAYEPVIRLWDVTTGRLLASLAGHTQPVAGLAISPDGTTLASADQSGQVRLWALDRP
jgi:WD40 repeat protein